MKYYLDTEFIEGKQKRFLQKDTKPTIDLISIGIVAEDGRDYYAISKDFNLKEAWNRCDEKLIMPDGDMRNRYPNGYIERTYWIRENVLKPIWEELSLKYNANAYKFNSMSLPGYAKIEPLPFTLRVFKKLIKKYGKSNNQISKEIEEFVNGERDGEHKIEILGRTDNSIEFYAYYADYDWVVFCWLFGTMINLPKGFPMYCIDLKQTIESTAEALTSFELSKLAHTDTVKHNVYSTYDTGVLKCSKSDLLKHALNYPKQKNEHNAKADANWNKELHEFLNTI